MSQTGKNLTYASGLDGPAGIAFNSFSVLFTTEGNDRIYRKGETSTELNDKAEIDLENSNVCILDAEDNLDIPRTAAGFLSRFDSLGNLKDEVFVRF